MNKSFVNILIVGLFFILPTSAIYAKNTRADKMQDAMSSMSSAKLAAFRAKFKKQRPVVSPLRVPRKHRLTKRKSPVSRLLASKSLSSKKLEVFRAKFRKQNISVPKKTIAKRKLTKPVESLVNFSEDTADSLNFLSNCLKWSASQVNQKARLYQDSILRYSRQYGVESNLVKSIITAESCFKVKALSHKGAQGLMQLIPETAERFGVTNSYDSEQNIRAGTRYLKFLLDRFDGDLEKSVAGYNAGEGAVDKYSGVPPYKETKQYVKNVLNVYELLKKRDARIIASRAIKTKTVKQYKRNKLIKRNKKGVRQVVARKAYKSRLIGSISGGNRFQPAHPLYRKNASNQRYAIINRGVAGKPGRQGWRQSRIIAPQLFKQ